MKDLITTAFRAFAAWWASGHATTAQAEPTPSAPAVQPAVTTITEEPSMSSKLEAYFAVIKNAASAVLTAEVSAPAGSTGADKLDIAKAALESAYPELGIADVAFEAVWPLVKPFIDTLVEKFKSVSVTSSAAPAPGASAVTAA